MTAPGPVQRNPAPKGTENPTNAPTTPPIVGIGASAGGLEAFESFFRACPNDSGMAFVLIPHLAPNHHSLLSEILQRSTRMPVTPAHHQLTAEANCVYIIPPNRGLTIRNGVLQVTLPEQARGLRMPIDAFLRSLADDQGDRAIGIVLSGTATDGTLGLRGILGAGGVCMVQAPAGAQYEGMPQSAINAGCATHVLPVEQMPALLAALIHKPGLHQQQPAIVPEHTASGIRQILQQVRSVTGHDFSLYKKSTIGRRIERRMAQHNIGDAAIYARFLKENPPEVALLFKELLINVTSFFRDPEAFVTLQQTILPGLLADKPDGYVFRVWVAGCASGEEAYSIAIVLRELLDAQRNRHDPHAPDISLQIYATDLDDDAIATARAGKFALDIAQNVTPERLRRFFNKEGNGYKVKKEIREMIVFAVQNVIKDPPFTRLDLLSCRNLMIYLEPALQDRLIPTFHFALKPEGVLLLSSSESIANHPELFLALDRKWKFYRARHATVTRPGKTTYSPLRFAGTASHTEDAVVIDKPKTINIAELSNRALLQAYAPPSVSTDADGNILYVHGDTGRYLRPAPGLISTNIVEMAREGLSLELRSALLHANTAEAPMPNCEVAVKTNGGYSRVSLSVRRLHDPQANAGADPSLLLISFQENADPMPTAGKRNGRQRKATPTDADRAEQLERELAFARESLQATIEEQQATNEELKSTNEELQSTNEELQSANEELETSKEELQSLNEEMITVNAEQNARIEQLSDLQNDMKNLLDSTNVGTVFLDHQLCIRRYTRDAVKAFRLVATDVGRPLGDIKWNFEDDELLGDLQTVLDTLTPREREVRSIDGAHYLARMQPYRTLNNIVEGVVLTFAEVTSLKQASDAAQRSAAQLAAALEVAHLGSWELEIPEGKTISLETCHSHWSGEMFKIFGSPPVDRTMLLQDVLNALNEVDRERVVSAIQKSLATRDCYDIEYQVTRPDGTKRDVHARGKAISDVSGRVSRLIGTTLDITTSGSAKCSGCRSSQALGLAEAIIDTVTEPLVVLDADLQVISANASFYTRFGDTAEQTAGRKIYDLGNGRWNIPALRELLEDILPRDQAITNYPLEHDIPGVGVRRLRLNARRIVMAPDSGALNELILLAMPEINDQEGA